MSKSTTIRKKALDLVRDQDWTNAIKEYKRLVELDQSNPNVHNELADIYLKTGQKPDAYDAFVRAIDEYTRVGLHNNAVAVCKKVLRVLPGRVEVLTKLGYIRARQGLAKEAESYYLQFLEKIEGGNLDAKELATIAVAMAEDMKDSATVLSRLGQTLMSYRLNDEAGELLVKLYALQTRLRDPAGAADTRVLVEKLGLAARLAGVAPPGAGEAGLDGPTITEANIWTSTHSEGERIEVEGTPRFTPPQPAASAPQPAAAAPTGPSERDLYLLRLARGSAEPRPRAAAGEQPAAPGPASEAPPQAVAVPEEEKPRSQSSATAAPEVPHTPAPHSANPSSNGNSAMNISALIDGDGENEEDFRSHYDLGMAYLEMDLLSEAIREYQLAAKSPHYQVKCLEMIGLCFVKQNQPQLAIRQLTKGLSLIGSETDDSLGIKYNLGLAYEMSGDAANARTYFEDVYVVDVTFRDVAEKISKLSEV